MLLVLNEGKFELLEKRKNPELNPKLSAYDQLKKYKDDPDIYISFTDINKIGIKPLSSFNTPNAIYTYPLKTIWKEYRIDQIKSIGNAVPFGGDRSYIQVLKWNKKEKFVQDMYKYSSKDYDEDIAKLRELINEDIEEIIINSQSKARHRSPIGMMWYITWKLSNSTIGDNVFGSMNNTQKWNNILRKLGYVGFADKAGKSFIHKSEPIQALFLTKSAFEHIETILNKNYSEILYNAYSELSKHYKSKNINNLIKFFIKNYEILDILFDESGISKKPKIKNIPTVDNIFMLGNEKLFKTLKHIIPDVVDEAFDYMGTLIPLIEYKWQYDYYIENIITKKYLKKIPTSILLRFTERAKNKKLMKMINNHINKKDLLVIKMSLFSEDDYLFKNIYKSSDYQMIIKNITLKLTYFKNAKIEKWHKKFPVIYNGLKNILAK